MPKTNLKTITSQSGIENLRSAVSHSLRSRVIQNAVIQRAKQRLCADSEPALIITSYDRQFGCYIRSHWYQAETTISACKKCINFRDQGA